MKKPNPSPEPTLTSRPGERGSSVTFGKNNIRALGSIADWFRAARKRERVRNPLRVRILAKQLWPWYLPYWLFPAIFVSEAFLGALPREKLVVRALLPFIACALIFIVPTWKIEISWRERLFFFKFVPLCTLLASGIIWAVIHDRYMK
jgi:hypothetical protein